MTRDEVLAVVHKYISEAREELNASTLDPARSMVDYGLGSLDIVEVVSRSMREFKVKVRRSELHKVTTINGFVDLLLRSAANREQTAPAHPQPLSPAAGARGDF